MVDAERPRSAAAEGGEQTRRVQSQPQPSNPGTFFELDNHLHHDALVSSSERKGRARCQKRAAAKASSYGASGGPRARCAETGYGMRLLSAQVALLTVLSQQGYEIMDQEIDVSLDEFRSQYCESNGYPECGSSRQIPAASANITRVTAASACPSLSAPAKP